jgi:hypothetical protein
MVDGSKKRKLEKKYAGGGGDVMNKREKQSLTVTNY